ncbi:MAG: radical SAM protein [Candidatus Marinimicrobia bacterium]|nr:radical SAM protein [Candidatus Neomarinimicrobiota bacterium]
MIHQSYKKSWPIYLGTYESGELAQKVNHALEMLRACYVCPRDCGVNRLENKWAVCKSGRYAVVSSYFPHFGEEDCLRGWKGSGTIFFSHCNLKCVFCQNFDISQPPSGPGGNGVGIEVDSTQLANMMLSLQEKGCHNINFVTPEHVVPQIVEALPIAIEKGLHLPLVYNTSAFDSLESLRLMDGLVDIYMPDFKFWDKEYARRYLKAVKYPEAAKAAIKEMHRQVGDLQFDGNGWAVRGLLVRHLIMPGMTKDSQKIFKFLVDEISPETFINVMDQYRPTHKVGGKSYQDINRSITQLELRQAYNVARELGLHRFDKKRFASVL